MYKRQSYDVAKNYVDETRNNIEADVLLVAIDINRKAKLFHDSPTVLHEVLRHQSSGKTGLARYATENIVLEGNKIKKHQMIYSFDI